MNKAPWSSKQLRKLGKCIQLGQEPSENLPAYDDVMLHYNDVAAETQEAIRKLDWESLLGDRSFEVTSRPKTIDTLRQKLQRDTSTPLPSIQDIAGVRFEAEMTLDEQDAVVTAIAGLFSHDAESSIKDMRTEDHCGYRAVHIWLRSPTRVEVQVRTHLQGEWANMYESLADVYGRSIRYGVLPDDPQERGMVESLQGLSTERIAQLESARNRFPEIHQDLDRIRAWYQGLSRGQRRRQRLKYEKHEKITVDLIRDVVDLEASIRTMMASIKGTFDTMRSNGRR